MLLIGTRNGLYRVSGIPFDDVECVFDCDNCHVERFDTINCFFAITDGDLYRSDDGDNWEQVQTPGTVRRVHTGPTGELYVGTKATKVYVSTDEGDSWRDLDFPTFGPSYRLWRDGGGMVKTSENAGNISTFVHHPAVPDRLVVGVEGVGIFISSDRGTTWERRDFGCHSDVHHIRATGPAEYITATGQGLYHSGDAGRTWARLDTDHTFFQFTFFSVSAVYTGSLFVAPAAGAPGTWTGEYGANGIILRSDDWGDTFEREPFPGEPGPYISELRATTEGLLAGTVEQDLDEPGYSEAQVLSRTDGNWQTAGRVPAGIQSVTVVPDG